MKLGAALLVVLVTACASSSTASSTPRPQVSQTVLSDASAGRTASPPAAASPTFPVSIVDFSCRLPVITFGVPSYGWTGGFLQFPGGTYTADPKGVINSIGDGELQTQAAPVLQGYALTWPFYDLARKRWVPVGAGQSSPDGSSYAFVAPPLGTPYSFLFIYTVATGAYHSVELNDPPQATGQFFNMGDFDGRDAYVVAEQVDGFPRGVWGVNPATGVITQVLPTSAGSVLLVQNGVAWVGVDNPTDPSPPRPPKGQAFDTIESINLSTRATTTWIYRPGDSVVFWGLDSSSHPVVMVTSGPDFGSVLPLILVDAPGQNGIAIPAGFLPLGDMQSDIGRLWFGGDDGIYYWTRATGLIKMYAFAPSPSGSSDQTIYPAGHCV